MIKDAPSASYEQANALVKTLAAAIREHIPSSKERHDTLGILTNLGAWLLLVDSERQDAVQELADVRKALTETLQQLTRQEDGCGP